MKEHPATGIEGVLAQCSCRRLCERDMSHGTSEFMSTDERAKFEQSEKRERTRNRDPLRPRTKAEFARFFDGMELVPPGIVALPDWRSELPPAERTSAADAFGYGAVARIP